MRFFSTPELFGPNKMDPGAVSSLAQSVGMIWFAGVNTWMRIKGVKAPLVCRVTYAHGLTPGSGQMIIQLVLGWPGCI